MNGRVKLENGISKCASGALQCLCCMPTNGDPAPWELDFDMRVVAGGF